MNIRFTVRSLILAGAVFTATMFASPSKPDALVPFLSSDEPARRVYVGTHRSEVAERIGEPSDRVSSDVWVYWDYGDPRRASNDSNQTLIINFTGDWVTRIGFTDTKATRAAFVKFQRGQAIPQPGLTSKNPPRGGTRATLGRGEDAEMLAAMKAGRTSTGKFLDAFIARTPKQRLFLVQIAIGNESSVEHIWLTDLTLNGAKPTGVIADSPQRKDLKLKQRIEFDLTSLSDWMYVEEGRLVGGFTIRLLRKRMTPQERAKADAETPYRME